MLPELEKKINKVIYLDSDILVLDDISKLWETNLFNKTLGAVKDPAFNRYNSLNLRREKGYFNSGVLLIDSLSWRTKNYSQKILEYINKYPEKLVLPDQDALNVILKDDWLPINQAWNVFNGLFMENPNKLGITNKQLNYICNHPKIYHFVGKIKPWNKKYALPAFNYKQYYSS